MQTNYLIIHCIFTLKKAFLSKCFIIKFQKQFSNVWHLWNNITIGVKTDQWLPGLRVREAECGFTGRRNPSGDDTVLHVKYGDIT